MKGLTWEDMKQRMSEAFVKPCHGDDRPWERLAAVGRAIRQSNGVKLLSRSLVISYEIVK